MGGTATILRIVPEESTTNCGIIKPIPNQNPTLMNFHLLQFSMPFPFAITIHRGDGIPTLNSSQETRTGHRTGHPSIGLLIHLRFLSHFYKQRQTLNHQTWQLATPVLRDHKSIFSVSTLIFDIANPITHIPKVKSTLAQNAGHQLGTPGLSIIKWCEKSKNREELSQYQQLPANERYPQLQLQKIEQLQMALLSKPGRP